jgi:hypothetical protein
MGLVAELKAMKRVLTGEVIQRIDSSANGGTTTMSLRLKRKGFSDDQYVVLGAIGLGNYQYYSFTRHEFIQFAQAVEMIRNSLLHPPTESG